MKILQFIYGLGPGGAERFIVDLCNEMTKYGNDIYLCILRDDSLLNYSFYKSELSDKIIYKSLKLKEGFKLSNIKKLSKVIKEIKPDVVHCHQNLVNYIFPLTIIYRKTKFFHTIHNDAKAELNNYLEFLIRKIFYVSQKMKAITISNETSKSFVKCYKSASYTQIYNGRKMPEPSDKFEDVKAYFDDLRKTSEIIFIHIGRFAPQKNQKMLINVFNRLIKEGRPIKLLVIGDGFESIEGEKLKSSASDKIIFLGTIHNIADYFLNADAFCLSSVHEGMPITIIESLACGCTPVCTPVGGNCDAIDHLKTGFLSKSTSEEDYYETLVDFLNQRQKIIKENLFQKYKNQFSIEECVNQHFNLYNN